jgi:ABC-type sugar transport system permease subunit
MTPHNFFQCYEKKEVRTAALFLSPLLLIVTVFILLPVIGTVYNSFFLDVSFLPKRFVGIKNYGRLLSSPDFWQALGFTIADADAEVFLEAVLGVIFALLLNEAFVGRNILRVVMLIPWAIPKIVSARTWQMIYEYTYGVMNFLVIALIFRTIDSLRMFDLVYVLTGGGPGGSTRTLSYLGFEAFANDSFGLGSTISVVTFMLSLGVTLIYLKVGKFSEQLK